MYMYSCVLFNKQLYFLILLLRSHVFQINIFFSQFCFLKGLNIFKGVIRKCIHNEMIPLTLYSDDMFIFFCLNKFNILFT